MRIAIIGAGGIGSFYAAQLLSADHDVTLIARGSHLNALQNNGLRVDHDGNSMVFPNVVATDLNTFVRTFAAAEYDLLIITAKSGETHSIAQTLSRWCQQNSDLMVLSLQNGVDNEITLSHAIDRERIIGGLTVKVSAHIHHPGRITATGPGQIILGPWPNHRDTHQQTKQHRFIADLTETFDKANIPTLNSENIRYELWRKLVINNGVNPLSATTHMDTHALSHNNALGDVIYQLMQEAANAAQADGVELTQADVDEMFQLIFDFDGIKTSMLVDREQGRRLELDAICGAVLQRCQLLQIDAPYTKLLNTLLKEDALPTSHPAQTTQQGETALID